MTSALGCFRQLGRMGGTADFLVLGEPGTGKTVLKHLPLLTYQRPKAWLLVGCLTMTCVRFATAADGVSAGRIVLEPEAGAMQVRARLPALGNRVFALGIPETIGCREALLVNYPEARVEWQGPDTHGVVSCAWGPGSRIHYALRLVPPEDFVEVDMPEPASA